MPTTRRRVAVALRIDRALPASLDAIRGIQAFAGERGGWQVLIEEHPDCATPDRAGRLYDGVIARATGGKQDRLRKLGIPFVNTLYNAAGDDVPGVYIDTERCGQIAAEHLMSRGFARHAYLGIGAYPQAEDIARSFADSVEHDGGRCDACRVEAGPFDDPRHWRAMKGQVARFVDALGLPVGILAANPSVARVLITVCQERGWHVPQQVAVVTIDDIRPVNELSPQISCIDGNYEAVGYEAAALLDRLMRGESPRPCSRVVPPKGIVTRESTDYFAVEDEVVAEALRYISSRLVEDLSVRRIAYDMAVAPRSLQRRFELALGRPVSVEVRRLRVEKAKRLLVEPGSRLERVAREAGFNSAVTLNQAFHRELGMSPGAYRGQVTGR